MQIILQLFLLVIGFVLLVKGADWFVDGVSGIAEKFGIPQLVIGLTIVAMGTSAPEAAVSLTAALGGTADITIGNILGSNVLNILIILGVTSVIAVVPVKKSTFQIEIPFVIFISVLILVFGITGNQISRLEGVVFILFFCLFLYYLYRMAMDGKEEVDEETKAQSSLLKLIGLAIFGMACVVLGSRLVVNSATELARIFGMSERFIALTIVALGTSLPELATSSVAASKGKADLAIGNIVGSNIFNVLFVVGLTALIIPVPFASSFIADGLTAIAAAILLWICLIRDRKLTRIEGIIMLAAYAAYFVYLIH